MRSVLMLAVTLPIKRKRKGKQGEKGWRWCSTYRFCCHQFPVSFDEIWDGPIVENTSFADDTDTGMQNASSFIGNALILPPPFHSFNESRFICRACLSWSLLLGGYWLPCVDRFLLRVATKYTYGYHNGINYKLDRLCLKVQLVRKKYS